MKVGGIHTIINMMDNFPKDADILENGCRAIGCFAALGMYVDKTKISFTTINVTYASQNSCLGAKSSQLALPPLI